MKWLYLAAATSLATLPVAHAADIIEPAAYDWTGPYVGLQAGYGWDKSDVDGSSDLPDFDPDFGSLNPDGFIGGLHAGYNWQSDSLVFGAEGDIEYADLKDSNDASIPGPGPVEIERKQDWLGSLRLRGGVAFDRTLVYATGGLAVGEVELNVDSNFIDDSEDKTKWGWTIGGGLEHAFTDELSLRLEYRYTDLGKTEAVVNSGFGPFVAGEVKNDFHAVRAGLSWHF